MSTAEITATIPVAQAVATDDKAPQIKRQMEFYLSDANLSRDKFLQSEIIKTANQSIPLSVFLTFNKIIAMSCTIDDIKSALESSDFLVVEEESVRRVDKFENKDKSGLIVVYTGIPSNATTDECVNFFKAVNPVMVQRKTKEKKFRGEVWVEFATAEQARDAINVGLVYEGVELHGKTREDFYADAKKLQKSAVFEMRFTANVDVTQELRMAVINLVKQYDRVEKIKLEAGKVTVKTLTAASKTVDQLRVIHKNGGVELCGNEVQSVKVVADNNFIADFIDAGKLLRFKPHDPNASMDQDEAETKKEELKPVPETASEIKEEKPASQTETEIKEVKPESQTETETEMKPEPQAGTETEVKPASQTEVKPEPETEVKHGPETETEIKGEQRGEQEVDKGKDDRIQFLECFSAFGKVQFVDLARNGASFEGVVRFMEPVAKQVSETQVVEIKGHHYAVYQASEQEDREYYEKNVYLDRRVPGVKRHGGGHGGRGGNRGRGGKKFRR